MGMIIAAIAGGIMGCIAFNFIENDAWPARFIYGIVTSGLAGYLIANIERYIYG